MSYQVVAAVAVVEGMQPCGSVSVTALSCSRSTRCGLRRAGGFSAPAALAKPLKPRGPYQPVDKISGCTKYRKILWLTASYDATCCTAHEAAAFCQRAVYTNPHRG